MVRAPGGRMGVVRGIVEVGGVSGARTGVGAIVVAGVGVVAGVFESGVMLGVVATGPRVVGVGHALVRGVAGFVGGSGVFVALESPAAWAAVGAALGKLASPR